MKNWLIIFAFIPAFLFSQSEEIGPITQTNFLKSSKSQLKSSNSFDSTFIYTSDTLNLPFYDEFSKNHFQQYNFGFNDPGVTNQLFHHLLDNTTDLPLSSSAKFTSQITYLRTYNLSTSEITDTPLPTTTVKVGSLLSYPVTYVPTSLYPPYFVYDTIGGPPNTIDTVWITNPDIVQDSARIFFLDLNDPNAYWLDSYALHNYTNAKEPRSIGVVTFDGLDEDGFPYQIGSTITNFADILTSKPLDLSANIAADSLYFSFLYQKQGFCDEPEVGDSLVLEFYAKDLDQWFHVWSTNGGGLTPFKVGHIPVTDVKYFKKGFQFRFKNYGSLAGALDQFHIDFVHLRSLSGQQDTIFKDFAFVYPLGSALKDYTSVPWDHFKANPTGKMNDSLALCVYNGSLLPENNQNGLVEISYQGTPEGNYTLPAQNISGGNINYDPLTFYQSYHDLSGGYIFDNSKPGDYVEFDLMATTGAQFPNNPINDSIFGKQIFQNYYSYDDGSAEAAYGPTGVQARLAIQYEAYEADSLIGIRMHFVPSVNDVSNKLFLLTVWADNGGVPGAVLYEDETFSPRQPIYLSGSNAFHTYYFKDTMKIAVGTKYYLGWRQFDADRLNIGLDRNLVNNQHTFYSVNNGVTWNNSSFEGSVMIHPVYSTSMDDILVVDELKTNPEIKVYPNPASDFITIDGFQSNGAIYAMDGRWIKEISTAKVDVSDLGNGVYFLKFEGKEKSIKLVISK